MQISLKERGKQFEITIERYRFFKKIKIQVTKKQSIKLTPLPRLVSYFKRSHEMIKWPAMKAFIQKPRGLGSVPGMIEHSRSGELDAESCPPTSTNIL